MTTLHNIYVDKPPSYLNESPRSARFQLHLQDRPFLAETLCHEGVFYRVVAVVHLQFEPSHIFVTEC